MTDTFVRSKGLTRRSFLKTTAAVTGTAAITGSIGCASVDVEAGRGAATDTEVAKTYVNQCRGNCGGTCPLEATVREGKVVRTSPMVFPKEATGMQLGCVKGHTNPQRLYSANRLMYPMKQTGERGSDNWERVSWDEATSLIAEKFSAAKDECGPASIGFWLGAGNVADYLNGNFTYFDNNNRIPWVGIALERFLATTGVTILSSSHDIAQLYFQATILQSPVNSLEDFQYTKSVFLWGANPADAARAQWPWVCTARDNGAKLIAIDPQYTNSAAHSDIWVPVRQGTDGALMLAMCNYIIENDLIDYNYLKNQSVAPLLIKEDGMYLRLSDLEMDLIQGEEDPETGKPKEIDSTVVWDEDTGSFMSSMTASNPALNGDRNAGGVSIRTVYDVTLEYIAPFTVEFAEQECGVPASQIREIAQIYATNKPSYILNNWGMEHLYNSWRVYYDLALLASLTGNACVSGAGYSSGFSGHASQYLKTPVSADLSSIAVENPKQNKVITGEYIYEITKTGKWAGEDFPIRCVYIMTSNPLHSCMGVTYIKEALDQIDFICVADSFMTDSAQYADLVLPIAMSFETEGHNGTFMTQKAVVPAGECLTDFDILKDVAAKMGHVDLYPKTAEEYYREVLDTPENLEAGLAFDNYREQGVITGEYSYAESVGVEVNAIGRTQFYLEVVPPRDDYGQEIKFEDHLPYYEHAYEAYRSNPLLEKYPLFGLSHHDNYHAQSLFSHNPLLDEFRTFEGEPYMKIHEAAAAERGITTGDTVRVFNDHGSCVLKAVVTKGIRIDTILVPHGFQKEEFIEGHPQSLTAMCPDPITSNNNMNDWLCQVEKQ